MPDSRKRLFEVIGMHDLEESFALATVDRAKQVSEAASSPRGADGLEVYASRFVQVIGLKLHANADTMLRQALRDAGYFTQVTKMLGSISISLVNRGGQTCLKTLYVPLRFITSTAALADEPNAVRRNIRDMLAGGFLHTFVRIMTNRQVNGILHEEVNYASAMLKIIGAWMVYPAVGKALFESLQEARLPDVDVMRDIPDVQDVWKPFWSTVMRRLGLWLDMMGDFPSVMCDNPHCHRPKRGPGARSRQCSRCGTMVYCSEVCQQADWKEQHKAECPPARALQLARREDGSVYDHKSCAFHAKYVERLYRQHALEIAATAEEQQRPISDFLPVFDCRFLEDSMHIRDTEELLANVEQDILTIETTEQPQIYLGARLAGLLGMYSNPFPIQACNVRLAQGIFQQGTRSFIVLSVLLREVEGQFEVAYSVPRSSLRM